MTEVDGAAVGRRMSSVRTSVGRGGGLQCRPDGALTGVRGQGRAGVDVDGEQDDNGVDAGRPDTVDYSRVTLDVDACEALSMARRDRPGAQRVTGRRPQEG